jgi:hypothetical protein
VEMGASLPPLPPEPRCTPDQRSWSTFEMFSRAPLGGPPKNKKKLDAFWLKPVGQGGCGQRPLTSRRSGVRRSYWISRRFGGTRSA